MSAAEDRLAGDVDRVIGSLERSAPPLTISRRAWFLVLEHEATGLKGEAEWTEDADLWRDRLSAAWAQVPDPSPREAGQVNAEYRLYWRRGDA